MSENEEREETNGFATEAGSETNSTPNGGELGKIAASILMGALYSARMGRFDLLCAICKFACFVAARAWLGVGGQITVGVVWLEALGKPATRGSMLQRIEIAVKHASKTGCVHYATFSMIRKTRHGASVVRFDSYVGVPLVTPPIVCILCFVADVGNKHRRHAPSKV